MKKVWCILIKEKYIIRFVLLELFFLMMIPFSSLIQDSTVFAYVFLALVCLSIYTIYLLYQIFISFNQRAFDEQQREMIVRQKEMQNQYILAQMQRSKDLEQLRTKMIEATQNIETCQKAEIGVIIDELLMDYGNVLALNYSKNKVIDAIIYHKVLLMKKLHIRYTIDIQVDECLPLSNYDIMSILNNMIDNAIESCVLLPIKERFIEISIKIVKNYWIVKIINAIESPNITLIPGVSSKGNSKSHGIGLMILNQICDEHQGKFSYNIDVSNKLITCIATCMLDEV